MIAPQINGFNEALNKRWAYDTGKAKALLAEAGYGYGFECQRRSKSTPLAGVKMHHLMRFSPALAVVPVVHRRDPRCFV